MFALLAFVFAASFVFLGVGSGSSGLSDFLNGKIDLFGGSSGTSTASLEKRVQKDPTNAKLRLDLAGKLDQDAQKLAGEGKGQEAAAAYAKSVASYRAYVRLRPNDIDGMRGLASELNKQAQQLTTLAGSVQSGSPPPITVLGTFSPAPSNTKLGQALASVANPYLTASALLQAQAAAYSRQASRIYAQEVAVYRTLARRYPDDPSYLFQAAYTQQQAGNTSAAIAAYREFIRKYPDDEADVALAKSSITQLESGTASTTSPTG